MLVRSSAGCTVASLVLSLSFTLPGCRHRTSAPPSTEPDPPASSETTADAGAEESEPPDEPAPHRWASPVLIRGARVMTATGVSYDRGDVLVREGKIAEIGIDLQPSEEVEIIDAAGKVLTPGIIDTHSHIGVGAAPGFRAHYDVNEAVSPVTADVRAIDGYWPQDPQIDTARMGGVTTMQVLPGSANLIGGRAITVRLIPGIRSAADAVFPGAPQGLKMACGENPKRVYGERGGPSTRMGNMAGYRKAFIAGEDYRKRWAAYRKELETWEASGANEDGERAPRPSEPGRDLGLETLAAVIDGQLLVHNHCYRADEMSAMLGIAAEFGFEIRSFHHAVEAYKIADRLARADTAVSIWADWWGFKAEAYDGILENAAMVSAAGARAIIHSDSAAGIQRLNQEAAKAMFAGRRAGIDISENEALRWITANAAWALGIEDQVGTIEVGKRADLTLWSASPFSVYTHAERVFIDGQVVFDRNDPKLQPRTDFLLGLDPEQPAITHTTPSLR